MSDVTALTVIPNPTGRPTVRTPEIVAEVLERVSEGEFLRPILREIGVAKSAWYDWVENDSDLAGRIARARDMGYDARAERLTLTARGKTEAEGGESTGDVMRDKLIIDTEFKALAKWSPSRYGDKLDLTSAGKALPAQPVVFAAVWPGDAGDPDT